MLSCSAQAVRATAGMDDELLRSLSSALFGLVNADRANRGLPPVTLVHRERDAWTWNDVCKKVTPRTLKKFLSAPVPQCSLPFAYSADRASEWRGRVPKDLLAEACGTGDLRYEPVLSLQNQVGHRAKGACSIRAFWMPYRAKVSCPRVHRRYLPKRGIFRPAHTRPSDAPEWPAGVPTAVPQDEARRGADGGRGGASCVAMCVRSVRQRRGGALNGCRCLAAASRPPTPNFGTTGALSGVSHLFVNACLGQAPLPLWATPLF